MMKNARTKTILAVVALLGTACSTMPESYKSSGIPVHKNQVDVVSFSHGVNFSEGSSVLSDTEKTGLDNFIYAQGLGYGDQLVLDFATGDPAWGAKMASVNNFLKTRGFWVKYATQSGSSSDVNSAFLMVNRYSVTPPDCQAISEESFVPGEMWTNKTFGCTTAQNLGLMVANPQDLIEGQPDALPATWFAVRAFQLYRSRFGLTKLHVNADGTTDRIEPLPEYPDEAK